MPFDHAAPAETDDARKTLSARSIHSRCAAARDLSRFGTPDDIPVLVKRAATDRSPAVRLGAAGAAADILSRYRLGSLRDSLSAADRLKIFELFSGINPTVNGGLFSLLACIGIPQGYQRIAVGLRDPRGDVRLAAAIGMLRLCESAALSQDDELEAAVVDLLANGRLKPDAAAEIAWVAARVGYRSARSAIGALVLSGAHAELRDRALNQLHDYDEPLLGAFSTDGRDAGEVNPTPAMAAGFSLFSTAGAMTMDLPAAHDDVAAQWRYLDGVLPGGIRRMFIRRVGDAEPSAAFQLQGRTWHQATEAQVCAAAMDLARADSLHWAALGAESPVDEHAAAIFDPWLPADATGDLARGLLVARSGDLSAAVAALQASVDADKSVLVETRFFLGQALMAAGDTPGAVVYLQAFVKKTSKRDPRRAVAVGLLPKG